MAARFGKAAALAVFLDEILVALPEAAPLENLLHKLLQVGRKLEVLRGEVELPGHARHLGLGPRELHSHNGLEVVLGENGEIEVFLLEDVALLARELEQPATDLQFCIKAIRLEKLGGSKYPHFGVLDTLPNENRDGHRGVLVLDLDHGVEEDVALEGDAGLFILVELSSGELDGFFSRSLILE